MSMLNEPAFPRTGEGFGNPKYDAPGMTLLDYFAAKAMQAYVNHISRLQVVTEGMVCVSQYDEEIVKVSFAIAQAMIAERNRIMKEQANEQG